MAYISNYNSDILLSGSGRKDTIGKSGSDIIVNVGSGSITFKGVIDKIVEVVAADGSTATLRSDNYSINTRNNTKVTEGNADNENYKSDFKQENLITFAE